MFSFSMYRNNCEHDIELILYVLKTDWLVYFWNRLFFSHLSMCSNLIWHSPQRRSVTNNIIDAVTEDLTDIAPVKSQANIEDYLQVK